MEDNWKEDIIKKKLGGKKEWTDNERMELCHHLDKDLNSQIASMADKKVPLKDHWTEDNWKEKMAEHPIFSPYVQEEGSKGEVPISDLSEGLAQLKYAPEHNTPSEMAQSYKEEGVNHFKYKHYRFAIASLTEGIKANCADKELNAQLHNNRAAAHFYLKNYRSALRDCEKATELKSGYMKAIQRGIQCAAFLKSWDEAIKWCDKGLHIQSTNEEFIKQRSLAVKEKKKYDRDGRKKALETKKELEENTSLLSEIAKRGIKIEANPSEEDIVEENPHQILLRDLEPSYPSAKESRVHLNSDGELVWPVVFLYPEHNESDCVLRFNENSRFIDHLEEMFGPDAPRASWDSDHKYKPQQLSLYFEERSKCRLVNVSLSLTLKEVLSNRRYNVVEGTPGFLVLVNNSAFSKEFIARHSA